MKRYIMAGLAAIVALSACTKEEKGGSVQTPSEETVKFYLVSDGDTKTVIGEGNKVVWSEGDRINVNGKEYNVLNDGKAYIEVDAAETYSAFYPASMVTGFDAGSKTFTFTAPDSQTYRVGGSFADNVNPMIATTLSAVATKDNKLCFHHIFGMLKLNLKGTDFTGVQSVLLRSNDDSALCGVGFTASCEGAVPSVTIPKINVDAYPNRITLSAPDAVALEDGAEFCFVLPAQTYREGFTFIVNRDNAAKGGRYTGNAQVVAAGGTLSMPELDMDEAYTIEHDTTGDIATATVKTSGAICLTDQDIWDITWNLKENYTDKGLKCNLVMSDARYGVNDDRGLSIFAKEASTAFKERCAGSVRLLNFPVVDEIGGSALQDCTALEEVKLEGGLAWIGDWAFAGCSNLKKIFSFSSSVPGCNDNAFNGVQGVDLVSPYADDYRNSWAGRFSGWIFTKIE